jgi:hypothetical protein
MTTIKITLEWFITFLEELGLVSLSEEEYAMIWETKGH